MPPEVERALVGTRTARPHWSFGSGYCWKLPCFVAMPVLGSSSGDVGQTERADGVDLDHGLAIGPAVMVHTGRGPSETARLQRHAFGRLLVTSAAG